MSPPPPEGGRSLMRWSPHVMMSPTLTEQSLQRKRRIILSMQKNRGRTHQQCEKNKIKFKKKDGGGDPKALWGALTRDESQEAERRARRAKTIPARLSPGWLEQHSSSQREAAAASGRPETCLYIPLWSINPSFTASFSRAWLIASILRRGRRRRRQWHRGDASASTFSAVWWMNFFCRCCLWGKTSQFFLRDGNPIFKRGRRRAYQIVKWTSCKRTAGTQ